MIADFLARMASAEWELLEMIATSFGGQIEAPTEPVWAMHLRNLKDRGLVVEQEPGRYSSPHWVLNVVDDLRQMARGRRE